MTRTGAIGIFALAALTIIPAAIGAVSLVVGYGDRCLLTVAEDRAGPLCSLGIRLRYRP